MDSWISGGSGPHELEKLKPGSYVLVEEAAPDGYLAAEPVSFVLEAKQEVQTVTMKDLACETLTITKKIKADEITWAHGNPTFLFSVKERICMERTYIPMLSYVYKNTGGENDRSGRLHGTVGTDPGNSGRKRLPGTGEEGAAVFAYAGDRYEECYREKLEEPAYGKDPARVFSVSVNLCGHPKESEVVFENQKYRWDDYGHNSIVKNRIPVE